MKWGIIELRGQKIFEVVSSPLYRRLKYNNMYISYRGGCDIQPPWFKAKFWRYLKLGDKSSLPILLPEVRNVSETSQ